MVGEPQWSSVIVDLADVGAFAQDTITPGWDARLVATVVLVCAQVILVGRKKRDPRLVVERECLPVYHLQI